MSESTPQRSQLRAFWHKRQVAAGQRPYSGYLADDSPQALGRARFHGEWKQVRNWLDEFNIHGGACLDVGCGSGEWTLAFAKHFETVTALDWAASMANTTRRRAKAAGLKNVTAKQGEVTRLKGKEKFNVIFIGGVLMYSTDGMLQPLMNTVQRLLKPGGILFLRESTTGDKNWHCSGNTLEPGILGGDAGNHDYAAFYRTASSLEDIILSAGLEIFRRQPNRHYKFADISRTWLGRINAWSNGALRRDPVLAEHWAQRIHNLSFFTLWPAWLLKSYKLQNQWFLAQKKA